MKAFIATFYSPEIQAELLNEILEYYGAQSTVQRATDLKSGGKKKSSKSHETKKYLAKQGQERSPQGIFLLNSAHLFKISQGKREAQFGRYQPNTSQESTCSFMHLWKPTHNVTLLLGQGQQIIPRLWW